MLKKMILPGLFIIPCLLSAQINVANILNSGSSIKILSVEDNIISEDNYSIPGDGNKFIAVNILLDNTKNKLRIYSGFPNFKLKDTKNNVYKSSIKTYVVREPYLVPSISHPGETTKGWVVFEVPKTVSVDSLWIRYDYKGILYSSWILLWPSVTNCEETKKIQKAVSGSLLSCKQNLIVTKLINSINDYDRYISTGQLNYFVAGIENVSQAKLFFDLIKKRSHNSQNKNLQTLNRIILVLNKSLPEKLLHQPSKKDKSQLIEYLYKLKKHLDKNNTNNQKTT